MEGRIGPLVVYLNGRAVGTARTGLARPDACASLSGVAQCPNVGVEFDLDTRLFGNGLYTLGLRVEDTRGNVTFFPRVVENWINVVIENR